MNAVPFFALAKAKQAHQHLREHGNIPAGMIPPTIAQSWQRSSAKGLPSQSIDFSPCQTAELRAELEKHAALLDHATPVMEMLHQQIIDSHSMVVLTNADGFILHSFGDDAFLERANRISLKPGVNWAEDDKGTNAIGTALIEERPISIHGHQHYFSTNHFLTCSASPILNPFGKVAGVLDVTGDHRSYSPHTLALVKMSVRLVENQMFAHAFPDAIVIHFHTRPEYLGTICEGMIAFSPDGQTLAANQNAYTLLGLRPRDIAGSCFEQIFNQSIKAAVEHTMHNSKLPLQLTNTRGVKMYCRGVAGSTMRSPLRVFTFPRAEETTAPLATATAAKPAAKAAALHGRALELLDTGDQQVKTVLQKVRRVIGRDIPILIHGETGVGKELLARAIHDDGPRHDKPFIAVNCAAIPEGLIESELFGYEEGAFTGAKRRGSCGKVLQAEGGTLFLDEIGDMPHPLQARLLRVLQERLVNPLGSTKSIPVDIHLVCATHRKLKDWVAAGKFREDLYYRLNGLTVNLPSLRARSDLPALINLILARLAPAGTEYRMAPEVMSMFLRHPWPGNIRQLSNLLRTATVMAGDDEVIGLEHLPDDFLDEFEGSATPAVAAAPAASVAPAAPTPAAPVAQPEAPADTSAALINNANNLSGMILSASQNLESTTLSLIQRTLEMHQGNVSAAARQLGVSRNTLYRKLRQIWQL